MPLGRCDDLGGAARGDEGVPIADAPATGNGPAAVEQTLEDLYQRVTDLIMEYIRGLGIHDREYEDDTYDCDDFASDLEEALEEISEGLGTFTYMACDYDEDAGTYGWAHAVTDVPLPGERSFWVEPQTAQVTDLDRDGDGRVEYDTDFSNYPTPTDGDCFIAVFENAQAAVDAGLDLD